MKHSIARSRTKRHGTYRAAASLTCANLAAVFCGPSCRVLSPSCDESPLEQRVAHEDFVDWVRWRQLLFCAVRFHSCLHLCGPRYLAKRVLASASCSNLSGVPFFAASDGPVFHLRLAVSQSSPFRVGQCSFQVGA